MKRNDDNSLKYDDRNSSSDNILSKSLLIVNININNNLKLLFYHKFLW